MRDAPRVAATRLVAVATSVLILATAPVAAFEVRPDKNLTGGLVRTADRDVACGPPSGCPYEPLRSLKSRERPSFLNEVSPYQILRAVARNNISGTSPVRSRCQPSHFRR